MALQFRRGTDAERQIITPKIGEPIYTTDQNELYVGDGTTQGGILISGTLVNEESPRLGTDLDLNGNNITGTGNINIDGTITATGNINLGDSVDDNIIVGGQIGSSLIPDADSTYDLGATASKWNVIYTTSIVADSVSGTFDGDLNGSIYADDSTTLLVDAVNGIITGQLTGDIRSRDNSETILNTDTKSLSVTTINIGNPDDGAAISGLDGIVYLAPDHTFLAGSDPDPANPFFRIAGFHNSVDTNVFSSLRARGSFNFPLRCQDGDEAIKISMYALAEDASDTNYTDIGSITGIANFNGSVYGGKWAITTKNNSGSFVTGLEIDNTGIKTNDIGSYNTGSVNFSSVPKLPIYSNDAARDSAIPSPETGMIIFNQRDDSTGVPQFQGYDGIAWVDLH